MKNKHRGSSFDDFLKEEGLFKQCNAEAAKRVSAFIREEDILTTRSLRSLESTESTEKRN